MPRKALVGSYKCMFTVLRNCQTVFKVFAPFYIPTVWVNSSYSMSSPALCMVNLLNVSHSGRCETVFIVVLICISLMTNDVICLFAIWISSLVKCLFKYFAYFLITLSVFLLLSCKSWVFAGYKLIFSQSSLVNTQSLTSAYISFQKCSNIAFTISGLIFSVDAAISASIHASWMVPSVQPLSRVQLFVIPWAVARQAPLSFTLSWSLLKFTSIM